MRPSPLARVGPLLLSLLPWLLAAGAAVLVITLRHRHDALAERYRTLSLRTSTAYAGLTLPSFEAVPVGGDSTLTVAAMAERDRQVLIVVRASCPFCKQTIPAWRTLVAALDSAGRRPAAMAGQAPRARMLALTLDSLPDSTATLFDEHALAVPVLGFPSARLRRLYRTSQVPQTLVVDSEGRVLFARTGVLSSAAAIDSILQAATVARPAAPPPTQAERVAAR